MPGAAALVRGLLVLARSGRSGVLDVATHGVKARVGVRGGRVVAMRVLPDDGDFLGDALRRMGAWGAGERGAPALGEPFGAWASRVGASSAAAVSHALGKQLERRMARLLGIDPPELRLTPGSADVGVPALEEPPRTAELVVAALRDRARRVPLAWARPRLGESVLVLTPLGKELVTDAVLWPEEAAMLGLLERGAPTDALLQAARGSARALRLLYALREVGACAHPEPRRGYATLLAKTRQLRKAARAAELLELPDGASPGEARKALRKLAAAVHPDRFGTSAPAAIRSASHEVMTALVRAQRDLR